MKLLVIFFVLAQLLAVADIFALAHISDPSARGYPKQISKLPPIASETVDSLGIRSGLSHSPLPASDSPRMSTPSTSQATSHRLPLPPPGQKAPLGSRFHPLPPPPKKGEPPRKTRSDIGPERPAFPLPLPKTYSADFTSSRHQPRRRPKRLFSKVVKSLKSFKRLFGLRG